MPESFLYDEEENPQGFQDGDGTPNGFEMEYLIRVPNEFRNSESPEFAKERGRNNFLNYASQLQATFARSQIPKASK